MLEEQEATRYSSSVKEQDIPIDIHVNKLLEWLISRRHCNRNWQELVLVIRQKINNAIQDMPEVDSITALLAGAYINYFHCCEIIEILKKTEVSSKNIFGQYSSQRMKDWKEINKLYEKENVYLAEAAQMLIRNVKYEIPSLKKQLAKYGQMQEECLKKAADYVKLSADFREKYLAACKQLGIEGKSVKKELLSLLDVLPEVLSAIATSAIDLTPARNYYVSFLNFTLNRDCTDLCLPVVAYILGKGNTTTFEWRTGYQPDIIEVTKPAFPLDIDNGSTEAGDEQIDFGDFLVPSESDDRSSSSPNGDFIHVEKDDCKSDANDQIDFGVSDINWEGIADCSGITVLETEEKQAGGSNVARDEDALTLFENPATRNIFYAELLELESFLNQRLAELISDEKDLLSSNIFQSAPSCLQMQSVEDIKHMLSTVRKISSELMSVKMKHLYLIKESSKYVDRLAESLQSKFETAEKMLVSEKAMRIKYQEAVDQQLSLEPQLRLIITKTKELQSKIESDISTRYKNRAVNIMGTF